jgi:altronate hydrolase
MAGEMSQPTDTIVMAPGSDNVAVALREFVAGETVEIEGHEIRFEEAIPFGHKVAIAPVAAGDEVIKYGEPIGIAAIAIARGEHVHVHNVASARLPGAEDGDG